MSVIKVILSDVYEQCRKLAQTTEVYSPIVLYSKNLKFPFLNKIKLPNEEAALALSVSTRRQPVLPALGFGSGGISWLGASPLPTLPT